MSKTERNIDQGVNLMTQFTYEALLGELEGAKGDVSQSLRDIGEAAGRESDWHDNAALDFANTRHDLHSSMLGNVQRKLGNVEIIQPSFDVDSVKIGNTVVVKYEEEQDEEQFTILGSADSGRKPGWISNKSAFAKNLLGKTVGDKITFESESGHKQKVRIVSILPGDF